MTPSRLLHDLLFLSTPYFIFELIGVADLISSSGIIMPLMLFLVLYLGGTLLGYFLSIQLIAKNLAAFGISYRVTKWVTEGLIWGSFLLLFFYDIDNPYVILGLLPALVIAITSWFILLKLSGASDKKMLGIQSLIWISCVILISILLSSLAGAFLLFQDFLPTELLAQSMMAKESFPLIYALAAGFMGLIVCLTLIICQECRLRLGLSLLEDFFREF